MATWSLGTVLAVSACVARRYGYLSVKEAYDMGKPEASTAAMVESILAGKTPLPEVTQADCELADAVLPWLLSREDLTPYDKGLRDKLRIWNVTGVPSLSVPYVSSGIIAYKDGQAHYANRDRWESIASSEPVGKEGDQIRDRAMTVLKKTVATSVKTPSDRIKDIFIYTLRDANGNAYKWKTDKNLWFVGDSLVISSARIIGHEFYKGYWFTELKNCRVKKAA